jgi:hypothetical protein
MAKLAGLDKPHAPGLPPRPRTFAKLPRGPEAYRPNTARVAGPGAPPPGFVRATTSATEWFVYWALARIFGNPTDPRVGPPFLGGWPDWTYQQGAGSAGARSKPDFTVYRNGAQVYLRVQTEYRHIYADAEKQAYDRLQFLSQSKVASVIDLFDYLFVNDPSGQAAIVVCKQALGLIQIPDPIVAGTAKRGSRQPFGG